MSCSLIQRCALMYNSVGFPPAKFPPSDFHTKKKHQLLNLSVLEALFYGAFIELST